MRVLEPVLAQGLAQVLAQGQELGLELEQLGALAPALGRVLALPALG